MACTEPERLTEWHLGDDGRGHLEPITGTIGIGGGHPEQVLLVLGKTLYFEVHILTAAVQETARQKLTNKLIGFTYT